MLKKIIVILFAIGAIIALTFGLYACEPKTNIADKTEVVLLSCDSIILKHDYELSALRDSFNLIIDKIELKQDVLLDSIGTELILAQFKIERVRKYYNICKANPTQDKFLKGWIGRAIQ